MQVRWLSGFLLATAAFVLLLSSPASAVAGFTGVLKARDPLKPVLTLTNGTSAPCQYVNSALGTVAISEVKQGGKVIKSSELEVSNDESLDVAMAAQLKTLRPGESADIPLKVINVGSKHLLASLPWSQDTGTFGLQFPIQPGKPLDITLTYDAPITVASGAPLCGTVTVASAKSASFPWKGIAIGAAALAVAAVLVFLVMRLRRHPTVKQGIAALFVLGLTLGSVPFVVHVRALEPMEPGFDVAPAYQGIFDSCMGVFRNHSDVTGLVLDYVGKARIIIDTNLERDNSVERIGDNVFIVSWDPKDFYHYKGHYLGTDPIPSYPCDRLFHELYHVYDRLSGYYTRKPCGDSYIRTSEVMATRAQNMLREELGYPLRTHYGYNLLPDGPCGSEPEVDLCYLVGLGCAQNNGDPHLLTFDHTRYDFQAVGEFVNTRDPAGDFEIQTRQQPFGSSRSVSVNTAVAMKVATDRIELRLDGKDLKLRINGKQQDLATTVLKSRAKIAVLANQNTIVTWPDGSAAKVSKVGPWGLIVTVSPVSARANKLEGLLGNFNGNGKDDLKIRGTNTVVEPKFEQIYPKFADSWRVDDRNSLFTYDNGASTKTYTDKSFPSSKPDIDNLPNRVAAEALCRDLGVTDPQVLDNCILDVALTGRPEFARAALSAQQVSGSGGSSWTVSATPTTAASMSFAGMAGQVVFISIPTTTLSDSCSDLRLLAPNGTTVSTGCTIGGKGMINRTVLPVAGEYRVVARGNGGATIQVFTLSDQQTSIGIDGPAKTAVISRPGEISTFTFTAQAGQRVFVDVPGSTLPDQCGVIALKDASGKELSHGCIINGDGYVDTTLLPTTGNYTVVVDPSERNVGQAAVRVLLTQEVTATLQVGGPSVAINMDKPGSVAKVTFHGTAGQRVHIDATDATVPDLCSGFTLHAPNGAQLGGNGCILSHKGSISSSGTVLPATGTYTVILDLGEKATGHLTLRAYL